MYEKKNGFKSRWGDYFYCVSLKCPYGDDWWYGICSCAGDKYTKFIYLTFKFCIFLCAVVIVYLLYTIVLVAIQQG